MIGIATKALGFLGKFATPFVLKFAAGALLAGGLTWFWMEFQNRGLEVELARDELKQTRQYYQSELQTKRQQLEQARANAVAERQTLRRREEQTEALQKRIARLRETPDENNGCPVHPDIATAVEWLRNNRGTTPTEDSGGGSGSTGDVQ